MKDYARVSGYQLAYDGTGLRDKMNVALKGVFTPEQALGLMLEGTNLTALPIGGGVYLISPASSEAPRLERRRARLDETIGEAPILTVRGVKASLSNAMISKKRSLLVTDSLVAEDIGKLPDYNLPEALQRISGVQIGRDRGEGTTVSIRGLNQVKTLINGREIFSDLGRDLTIEYVPTEIFAGVEIYKNPSAGLIEGGVGGTINLKTHRPFDFKTSVSSVGLRSIYYDLIGQSRPQISALISNRFSTPIGEFGLLLTFANVKSVGRQDQIGTEPFYGRYNLVDFNHNGLFPGTAPPASGADPGDQVIAPNGGGNAIELMSRDRQSLNTVVQWRPRGDLEIMLEMTHLGYGFSRNSAVVYANRGNLLAQPGAVFTFADGLADNNNVVRSGAYADIVFTSNPNYFDRSAFTEQAALSLQWAPKENLKLAGDVAFTQTKRTDRSGNIRIGNAPTLTGARLDFDLRGPVPHYSLDDFDVSDPNLYRLIDLSHTKEQARGTGIAANIEATRQFASGPVKKLTLGIRHASQSIRRQLGMRAHISSDLPISLLPEAASPLPFDSFYLSRSDKQLFSNGLLGAPFGLLRNKDLICQAVGDTICEPEYDPTKTYTGSEKTQSLYGELSYAFQLGPIPVSGNFGARYLETRLIIDGYRTSNTAQSQPISRRSTYNNFLPSFNARFEMTPKLIVRIVAAKQVTRPKFQELAPNLTISTQSFNTLIGRAGNPDLRPLYATSYDGSLEYYFSRSGYGYLTLFEKEVEGFIQTVTREEAVAFPDFPGFKTGQILRPENGGKGRIGGLELGLQTGLDPLPAPFNALMIQTNYTRVNSHAPGPLAGTSVPLVGLSKNSYNLIGNYEKGPLRARLAYSWRDEYVDTTSGPGSGNLPIYAGPFGTLDVSIGIRINRHVDLALDVGNIQRSQYTSYFGNPGRTRFYSIYDRRLGVTLRLTQ